MSGICPSKSAFCVEKGKVHNVFSLHADVAIVGVEIRDGKKSMPLCGKTLVFAAISLKSVSTGYS